MLDIIDSETADAIGNRKTQLSKQ